MPAHDQHADQIGAASPAGAEDTHAQWEARYANGPVWSGRVNSTLAHVSGDLAPGSGPGTALDVGCGEGADAIWLAGKGWQATGIDLSQTAIGRARTQAKAAGVNVTFAVHDITEQPPAEQFDLVTGSFLHSPDPATRERLIRATAASVRIGGQLLLISHASMPPWAARHREQDSGSHHTHHTITPDDEVRLLEGLGVGEWHIERAETLTREATGPEGETAVLKDAVLLARRTA